MLYRIAICDDSLEYCHIVSEIIESISKKNKIECTITIFVSGKELIKAFKENNFDIIFLDMEMPELNGIETGLLIRQMSKDVIILYLTSHKEYAYDSYKVKAKNYLLKPVSEFVIEQNILECIEEKKQETCFLDIKDVSGIIHRIPIKDITHILRKKEDRKIHIYKLDRVEITVADTLENIERVLSFYSSITRASKSCLVNVDNVKLIEKNEIYFINDAKEYASRRCLSLLLKNHFNRSIK
jgi:DNA-binding LytR/AlgR family response regulator